MAEDTVQKFMIGDVEVLRVVEWRGPLALPGTCSRPPTTTTSDPRAATGAECGWMTGSSTRTASRPCTGPDRRRCGRGGHRIDEHLVLAPAPGHTPGSSVLRVASRGERAVFVGDLLHSPVQILRPECSSCFCLDPRQAAGTRRRELERAADERALVIPAHFAGAGAVEVRRARDGFTLHRWAA